jgi:outer membrane protein OmpU
MNNRLLLGSTALVGAGVLFAGAVPAEAQNASPITVTLSGYTEVGVRAATEQTNFNGVPDQGYNGYMDTEVHVQAIAKTDSGITYGSYVAMDLYANENADNSGVNTDEANLFFSGGFGRIELGRQDGAEDVMFVGAEDAQSGTGGIDGDVTNLPSVYHISNGDSAKAIYYTPRIGGFQFGADVVPDQSDNGGVNCSAASSNPRCAPFAAGTAGYGFGAGANWVGSFAGFDLTLSTTGAYTHNNGLIADPQPAPSRGQFTNNDQKDVEIGGLLGLGGLSFGASAGHLFSFNQGSFAGAGLKYKFGNASASVGYNYWDPNKGGSQNFFVISGDIGLMPGVTLKADGAYNDHDTFKHDDGTNPGGTWALATSIQLDY